MGRLIHQVGRNAGAHVIATASLQVVAADSPFDLAHRLSPLPDFLCDWLEDIADRGLPGTVNAHSFISLHAARRGLASIRIPVAASIAPVTVVSRRSTENFSMPTYSAMPAIQMRFMIPPTNSSAIRNKQHPRQ